MHTQAPATAWSCSQFYPVGKEECLVHHRYIAFEFAGWALVNWKCAKRSVKV